MNASPSPALKQNQEKKPLPSYVVPGGDRRVAQTPAPDNNVNKDYNIDQKRARPRSNYGG